MRAYPARVGMSPEIPDVAVTPDTTGGFTVICDHHCGTGHGNMKMKVTVVE